MISLKDLESPVRIELKVGRPEEVPVFPKTYYPECFYETDMDRYNSMSTWLRKGCKQTQLDSSSAKVTCECTHLTKFTAGVDLETPILESVVDI
jgi:hypothetical protein